MSYKTLALLLFVFTIAKVNAQADQHTHYFDPQSKLTWLGLDFSQAKIIGGEEQYKILDIHVLLEDWNKLMVDEREKFNVTKMLHRKTIDYAIDVTLKHNADLNLDNLITNNMKETRHLGKDSIADIISGYDFGGHTGNGLIFIVESFSKIEEMSMVWVTFVDMDNKTVLFTRRLSAEGSGIMPRNFYANGIFRVMEQVRKEYYTQWSHRK
jgi:hypothetical protein